jgi:hypothetical protein
MSHGAMLFQVVTLLLMVANPVAASSVEGDIKPLKILTLGKRCHRLSPRCLGAVLTCL